MMVTDEELVTAVNEDILNEYMPTPEEQLYWARWTSVWIPGCITNSRSVEEAARDAFTHGIFAAMHDLDWSRNLINALTASDPRDVERMNEDVRMAALPQEEYNRELDEITDRSRAVYMEELVTTFVQLDSKDQIKFRNRLAEAIARMDDILYPVTDFEEEPSEE